MIGRLEYARRSRIPSRIAIVLLPSMVAVGCGSSGDDGGQERTSTPTSSSTTVSLAAQTDALCAVFDQFVVANGPLGLDGFDPHDPDPAELPRLAEHFAPVLDAADALHDELASLTGGSPDEQARLADLVAALDAENANARAQADAARRSDVGAFTATLPAVETLTTARIDAANALGASHCATP